jgi:hypothetical protein
VVLNEYCDETGDSNPGGTVSDHLYNWLVNDLQATTQRHIFVFGHEPAFPQPDADNGRTRHIGDCLDADPVNRDRFWSLLRDRGVVAYFCGHTHNYSAYFRDGVWQMDVGHARGAGDTGSAGTFLMIHVDSETVTFNAYRDEHDGVYDYLDIVHSGTLYDSCRRADFENDGDVDGLNLAKLAGDLGLLYLPVFASEFGRTNCN